MVQWRIFHKDETVSTNIDAASGRHGDVFTAGFQSAGKGRLGHKWFSPAGMNLVMSAVLDVGGIKAECTATFPLVCGLAVAKAATRFSPGAPASVKWPNDVYVCGAKMAGILCERRGDNVIAGIGVNVMQTEFPEEISSRATSFALLSQTPPQVCDVRDAVLEELSSLYCIWRENGFKAVYPEISSVDFLKGRAVCVRQTDDDDSPAKGLCGGILADGSLDVAGVKVYAGEAHVEAMR